MVLAVEKIIAGPVQVGYAVPLYREYWEKGGSRAEEKQRGAKVAGVHQGGASRAGEHQGGTGGAGDQG